MSIEIFDDDIEQLRDDLSVEPWNVISNDDVRNSCLLPIRISYEFVDIEEIQAQQKRDSYDRQFYLDYLKSDKWIYKKLERYLIDKGLCQECHEPVEFEKSHCHHKTYANLFNEPMDDLETLHAHCHINIRHAGKNSQS
jgi:hypothetical protein